MACSARSRRRRLRRSLVWSMVGKSARLSNHLVPVMGVCGLMGSLVVSDEESFPAGAVSLSSAVASLRGELTRAWWDGRRGKVRFRPAPIELTLEVGVTATSAGSAGVRWWLVELAGELSRESAATQTIKLTLDPVLFDDDGKPIELFIDADDTDDSAAAPGDISLDAPD